MSDETTKQRCCAACCNTSTALKTCAACKSVWYCNRNCQLADLKAHRSMCKKIMKARQDGYGDVIDVPGGGKSVSVSAQTNISRNVGDVDSSGPFVPNVVATATSISQDEGGDLFAPPPQREDCPVCMVTLPLLNEEASYQPCCGKLICRGCFCENRRVLNESNANRICTNLPLLEECCPFCRTKTHETDAECIDRFMKRVDLNDPLALHNMAGCYRNGMFGVHTDVTKAFELTQRAADSGFNCALCHLAISYAKGDGVAKDPVKALYYFELAAKRGDVMARYNLGCIEEQNGNLQLACKHWMLAASAGSIGSLKVVKKGYCMGFVSKEDYASTLRNHQKAQDEQWSKEREKYKRTDLPPNSSFHSGALLNGHE